MRLARLENNTHKKEMTRVMSGRKREREKDRTPELCFASSYLCLQRVKLWQEAKVI